MKATFENLYGMTSESINAPFVVQGVPMGVIENVNEQTFSVLIWDRFIGAEYSHKTNMKDEVVVDSIEKYVSAIYLEANHNFSFSELANRSKI